MEPLSEKARQLLLHHEGFSQPSEWPGGQSGVTIGIGYDLGQCSIEEFKQEWGDVLDAATIERLCPTVGLAGDKARAAAKTLTDVKIPIAAGEKVFFERSMPKYQQRTANAFPGVEKLPADAQGALVSLVYNRGTSFKGDSRREMRAIRDLVPQRDLKSIAEQIRAMKRLWEGKGLAGLIRRREDEAALIEQCEV
jgi:GH24 family phage-related lysozyme (muramidase)